jgi:hypothetical protein
LLTSCQPRDISCLQTTITVKKTVIMTEILCDF